MSCIFLINIMILDYLQEKTEAERNSKRDKELLQRVRIFIPKLVCKKFFEQSLA